MRDAAFARGGWMRDDDEGRQGHWTGSPRPESKRSTLRPRLRNAGWSSRCGCCTIPARSMRDCTRAGTNPRPILFTCARPCCFSFMLRSKSDAGRTKPSCTGYIDTGEGGRCVGSGRSTGIEGAGVREAGDGAARGAGDASSIFDRCAWEEAREATSRGRTCAELYGGWMLLLAAQLQNLLLRAEAMLVKRALTRVARLNDDIESASDAQSSKYL